MQEAMHLILCSKLVVTPNCKSIYRTKKRGSQCTNKHSRTATMIGQKFMMACRSKSSYLSIIQLFQAAMLICMGWTLNYKQHTQSCTWNKNRLTWPKGMSSVHNAQRRCCSGFYVQAIVDLKVFFLAPHWLWAGIVRCLKTCSWSNLKFSHNCPGWVTPGRTSVFCPLIPSAVVPGLLISLVAFPSSELFALCDAFAALMFFVCIPLPFCCPPRFWFWFLAACLAACFRARLSLPRLLPIQLRSCWVKKITCKYICDMRIHAWSSAQSPSSSCFP